MMFLLSTEVNSIDSLNICKDIIIPLITAFISGGLTLIGVIITIKANRKEIKKAKENEVRPYLYSCQSFGYNHQNEIGNQHAIIFEPNSECIEDLYSGCLVRNTDNAIAIINKIESEKVVYYPQTAKVLNKNEFADFIIKFPNKLENLKKLKLYIEDIYGNEYVYELKINGTTFELMGNGNLNKKGKKLIPSKS